MSKKMDDKKMNISILGSGSWATAIALLLLPQHNITMWGRSEEKIKNMQSTGFNNYLPNHSLKSINLTASRSEAIFVNKENEPFDFYVMGIPSKYLNQQLTMFQPYVSKLKYLLQKNNKNTALCFVSLTKGFENVSWRTPAEMMTNALHLGSEDYVFALSGPSHAEEVALKMPTLVTLATNGLIKNSATESMALLLQQAFKQSHFKTYLSGEMLAVEMAGATKNIVAIAGGICMGLGYGSNTMAALITRGLKEMQRFVIALLRFKNTAGDEVNKKQAEERAVLALYGLSGVGDLIATAASEHSRNHRLGLALAKGVSLQQYLKETGMVCEGANAVAAVHNFATLNSVYMPITAMVNKVLFENYDIKLAIKNLMSSSTVSEFS